MEQSLRSGLQLWQSRKGTRIDPFAARSSISPRGYSKALQRAIVSFGLDFPYGQCCEQLLEHYGILAPKSSIRNIVDRHSRKISSDPASATRTLPSQGADSVVVQLDGSMIATIEYPANHPGADLRKSKRIEWREYKLCAARKQGSTKTFYDGGFDRPEEAGVKMARCALKAGWSSNTYIHGVGDGAAWIKNQFEVQFQGRGYYLLDFFHLSEYLSDAGKAAGKDKAWLKKQQLRLKAAKAEEVLQELANLMDHLPEDNRCVVDHCIRYMSNRPDQLDYAHALDMDLPIGSGIIESAHRHLLQRRLKMPGAWILDNAEALAAARIIRANEGLDSYWESDSCEKAA